MQTTQYCEQESSSCTHISSLIFSRNNSPAQKFMQGGVGFVAVMKNSKKALKNIKMTMKIEK